MLWNTFDYVFDFFQKQLGNGQMSSQLTNSYFSEGRRNHQPDDKHDLFLKKCNSHDYRMIPWEYDKHDDVFSFEIQNGNMINMIMPWFIMKDYKEFALLTWYYDIYIYDLY